jgi:hypothetical protein
MFVAGNGVGYANVDIRSDEEFAEGQPVEVRLSGGPSVSGTVVAEGSGVPLGGVKVYPRRLTREGDPWRGWNAPFGFKSFEFTADEAMSATSRDGDGAFTLGPLPPGDYELVIGLPSAGSSLITPVSVVSVPLTVLPDQNVKGLTLAIPLENPAYSLRGRVLRSDGVAPLASTQITVEVSHDYRSGFEPEEWSVWEPIARSVITDAQGNFRLYPIARGKYNFVVKWDTLSARRTAAVLSNWVSLDLVLGESRGETTK